MDTGPNYKDYKLDELEDAYSYIDKEAYPERAERLKQEIQTRISKGGLANEVQSVSQPSYIPPKGNWLKLHWKGLLPLEVSYWTNVFAVGLVIIFLSTTFFKYFSNSNAEGALRGIVIIAFYLLITAITVWQLVGLYRSADKHPSRGGTKGWALIAKIMVLIGVTRYCYDMSQTGVPFILESGKMVVGTSTLPPMFIRVMNNGTEIEIQGGLDFGASEQLSEALAKNPSVKIVHLNSLGGRIAEAKKLASLIKKKKLNTYTKTQCLSACPIVFLAGADKLLGSEAKLGFHSASFGGVSGSEYEELNEGLVEQLELASVPKWFINKVTNINSSDMWNPDQKDLLKAGLVDKVVDSGDYALSGVTDWKNPVSIDAELQKHEMYKNLFVYDNEGYTFIRDILFNGTIDGTPLNTLSSRVNDYLYNTRISYFIKLGGDAEVIEYMRSQIEQMEFLRNDHPEECASYTYPEVFEPGTIKDIPSLLSGELVDNENLVLTSLIKSISSDNIIANKERQTELITAVVNKIIAVDSSYQNVLSSANEYKNDPQKLCTVALMLNKEITLLPPEEAGQLLRSFFCN